MQMSFFFVRDTKPETLRAHFYIFIHFLLNLHEKLQFLQNSNLKSYKYFPFIVSNFTKL